MGGAARSCTETTKAARKSIAFGLRCRRLRLRRNRFLFRPETLLEEFAEPGCIPAGGERSRLGCRILSAQFRDLGGAENGHHLPGAYVVGLAHEDLDDASAGARADHCD